MRTDFALPLQLSLSQLTSFLTFTVLILSPIPPWGERVSSCLVLRCQLELNHDRWLFKYLGKKKKDFKIPQESQFVPFFHKWLDLQEDLVTKLPWLPLYPVEGRKHLQKKTRQLSQSLNWFLDVFVHFYRQWKDSKGTSTLTNKELGSKLEHWAPIIHSAEELSFQHCFTYPSEAVSRANLL